MCIARCPALGYDLGPFRGSDECQEVFAIALMNARRCPSLGYDLGFHPLGYDLGPFRGSDECQEVSVIRI